MEHPWHKVYGFVGKPECDQSSHVELYDSRSKEVLAIYDSLGGRVFKEHLFSLPTRARARFNTKKQSPSRRDVAKDILRSWQLPPLHRSKTTVISIPSLLLNIRRLTIEKPLRATVCRSTVVA